MTTALYQNIWSAYPQWNVKKLFVNVIKLSRGLTNNYGLQI